MEPALSRSWLRRRPRLAIELQVALILTRGKPWLSRTKQSRRNLLHGWSGCRFRVGIEVFSSWRFSASCSMRRILRCLGPHCHPLHASSDSVPRNRACWRRLDWSGHFSAHYSGGPFPITSAGAPRFRRRSAFLRCSPPSWPPPGMSPRWPPFASSRTSAWAARSLVTSTLASEFSPGRIRGSMTGNIMAAFPVGLIVAAVLSLSIIPTLGWRALFVVGVVPAVLLFFVRRYMPESVRYLLSKGRVADAEKIVADIEQRALGRSLTVEEIRAAPKVKPEVAVPTGVTVFELFTPGRARTTVLVWIVSFGFLWASNGILFMLPTILTQRGIPLTDAIAFQLVQAIGGFFGYSSCSFLIDRYGRRPVLFLYYFVGAFFHLAFAMSTGFATYVTAFLVGWVNPGVYGATSVYVGELHPTHLRATAVGWFFGIGRIGSFLAPSVVGFMLAYGLGGWTLYTFALSYLIVSIALIAVGVETKGRVLEEITQGKPA